MYFEFSKYSGCGNDFILIDNRSGFFNPAPALIQNLCVRCTGIGADGVILLENSAYADFRMRIYNADGKEAEMCGNGIRCLMKFIRECGCEQNSCTIETFLRPLTVTGVGELISVEMGTPFDLRWHIPLTIDDSHYTVHHINTGVPHLILFTEALQEFNLAHLGPKFRHHALFAPHGANLNVVHAMPNGELWNRTYERGVEGETLACGTGCVAAAIAASQILGIPSPLKVRPRSGELLEISFDLQNYQVYNLIMTGPAIKTFSGKWSAS